MTNVRIACARLSHVRAHALMGACASVSGSGWVWVWVSVEVSVDLKAVDAVAVWDVAGGSLCTCDTHSLSKPFISSSGPSSDSTL